MKKKKGIPIIYGILLFINLIVWLLGSFLVLTLPNSNDRITYFLAIFLGDGTIVFTMFLLSSTIERIDKIEEKLEKKEETEPPNDTNDGNN